MGLLLALFLGIPDAAAEDPTSSTEEHLLRLAGNPVSEAYDWIGCPPPEFFVVHCPPVGTTSPFLYPDCLCEL